MSYLPVSTARQGASGLGLEAQRSAVAGYLNGEDWTLVREVQASGFTSLRTIAAELNARGETSTRDGLWSAVQVQRFPKS